VIARGERENISRSGSLSFPQIGEKNLKGVIDWTLPGSIRLGLTQIDHSVSDLRPCDYTVYPMNTHVKLKMKGKNKTCDPSLGQYLKGLDV
jgi:hypothetical protein